MKPSGTTDEDDPAAGKGDDPVLAAIAKVAAAVEVLGQRVSALESGKTTDSEEKVPPEAKTTDADEKDPPEAKMTGDSSSLVAEFQDAKSRAEILAPGIKFPTFDAKADLKTSVDALCSFRRRALTVALAGEHEDLIKVVTGDADVGKLTCDSAKAFFNAASELVKNKNASVQTHQQQVQSQPTSSFQDINKTHAAFWARKPN